MVCLVEKEILQRFDYKTSNYFSVWKVIATIWEFVAGNIPIMDWLSLPDKRKYNTDENR